MAFGAAVQAPTPLAEANRPAGQVPPELQEVSGKGSVQFPPWARAPLYPMTTYATVYANRKRGSVTTRSPAAYWLW